MSLFDACEQFFKQINPQHYFEDEDINVLEEEQVDSDDDEYSYCPPMIAASQLVKYLIHMESYLRGKKHD